MIYYAHAQEEKGTISGCYSTPSNKGCASYAQITTIDRVVHPTFKAARKAMSFLDDENEWIECIKEAAARAIGIQLQQLFATILTHCEVAKPKVAMGVGLGSTLKRYLAQTKNEPKLSNIAVDCFSE